MSNEIVVLNSRELVNAQTSAEIDMQIATAKRYPREISVFIKRAMELATIDEEVAGSMIYYLPRGGKSIEGASVRLAEIVASSYGNLRVDARIVAIDETHITAEGTCIDLECNNAIRVQVKRRITNKYGKRYDEDLIVVTGNAACAIAFRNAVFKVIPFALIKPIYQAAIRTSVGEEKTLSVRRVAALEWFAKQGANKEKVLKLLERKDVDDLTLDDLTKLRGLMTAINEGDTTIEMTFKDAIAEESKNKLNDKLAEKKAKVEKNTNGIDVSSLLSQAKTSASLFKIIGEHESSVTYDASSKCVESEDDEFLGKLEKLFASE